MWRWTKNVSVLHDGLHSDANLQKTVYQALASHKMRLLFVPFARDATVSGKCVDDNRMSVRIVKIDLRFAKC